MDTSVELVTRKLIIDDTRTCREYMAIDYRFEVPLQDHDIYDSVADRILNEYSFEESLLKSLRASFQQIIEEDFELHRDDVMYSPEIRKDFL